MNTTNEICRHYFVSGKVQGVWFRANTQREARQIGLTGWVRNMPDGRVEVMSCGPKEQVELLEIWLRRGPERAEVTLLQGEDLPWQAYSGFDVL